MRRLDVGIIGAGTAGAAAAILLARAGHAVTVYERVPEPGPAGAGIVLQPSGMAVLQRIGILAKVAGRGARIRRLDCETVRGKKIVALDYAALHPGWFGVGLHRGVLFQSLHEALAAEPIALRCGVEVVAAKHAGRGRRLVDAQGRAVGEHELVVVADGARSRLRDGSGLTEGARPYPWGALWFVARDPSTRFRGRLYQVVDGPRRMLGLLPTGLGPSGACPHVSVFWSLRVDRLRRWQDDGVDAWKRECAAMTPEVAPALEQIERLEDLTFATYHDVVMSSWNTRSTVYIGDAAHAMSPQLGQGCNLALVDAAVLADCVAEAAHLPSALDAYTRRRREHLDFYQRATRWLTPFFQSDAGLLGALRDALMGGAHRVPFVHREMVRSMAGTKAGWLAGTFTVGSFDAPEAP